MSNIEICHTETAPLRTWTNPEKYFQVWNTMKEDRQNTFRYGMSKKKKNGGTATKNPKLSRKKPR